MRFAKFLTPLRFPLLLTALTVTAMTSLPANSGAAVQRACDYQYYYDAAHTQPSGFCVAACYPGGAYCEGVITEYRELAGCEPCYN